MWWTKSYISLIIHTNHVISIYMLQFIKFGYWPWNRRAWAFIFNSSPMSWTMSHEKGSKFQVPNSTPSTHGSTEWEPGLEWLWLILPPRAWGGGPGHHRYSSFLTYSQMALPRPVGPYAKRRKHHQLQRHQWVKLDDHHGQFQTPISVNLASEVSME